MGNTAKIIVKVFWLAEARDAFDALSDMRGSFPRAMDTGIAQTATSKCIDISVTTKDSTCIARNAEHP